MASNQIKQYTGFDYGLMDPDDPGQVICFPSNANRCVVIKTPKKKKNGKLTSGGFSSPKGDPGYHDEVLRKATLEINEILMRVASKSRDSRSKGCHLHLLHTEQGPMLAWVKLCVHTAGVRKL